MKCYEHTLIAKQDLQEDEIKSLINKYKDLISMNSGKVLKTEEWGLKNFSHKNLNPYLHIEILVPEIKLLA